MSDAPPLHPDVAPLAPLLGSWKGKGSGTYPGIDDFEYLEMVTFTQVGKPFIAYTQRTRDASTGAPLHAETGYLRTVGGDRGEFLIAQPSGVAAVPTPIAPRKPVGAKNVEATNEDFAAPKPTIAPLPASIASSRYFFSRSDW